MIEAAKACMEYMARQFYSCTQVSNKKVDAALCEASNRLISNILFLLQRSSFLKLRRHLLKSLLQSGLIDEQTPVGNQFFLTTLNFTHHTYWSYFFQFLMLLCGGLVLILLLALTTYKRYQIYYRRRQCSIPQIRSLCWACDQRFLFEVRV